MVERIGTQTLNKKFILAFNLIVIKWGIVRSNFSYHILYFNSLKMVEFQLEGTSFLSNIYILLIKCYLQDFSFIRLSNYLIWFVKYN